MTTQATTNNSFRNSFWFHLILVLLVCVVLYYLFFASLGWLTHHGAEAKVPNVTGKHVKEAEQILSKAGFEVEVDSTYEPAKKALIVLRQSPELNSTVKEGRTIFLTVNKAAPPLTPMPNLINLSFRSATLIIKSNRLVLGDTTYRPDIAKGAILEQLYNGVAVRPGMMIPQGSRIDLVIGDGLGNTEMNVPDVTGLTYPEAIAVLNSRGLQYAPVSEGLITDTASAIVYMQTPNAINELGNPVLIKQGDFVDIHFKQNATQQEIDSIKNANRVDLQEPDAVVPSIPEEPQ